MLSKKQSDPKTLGYQYGLGNYWKTYKPFLPGVALLYILYFAIVLEGLNTIVGLFKYPSSLTMYVSLGPARYTFGHGSVSGGLIVLGLGAYAITWVFRCSWLCVHMYEKGFIYMARKSVRVINWQEIQEIRYNIHAYRGGGLLVWFGWRAYSYTIQCANGTYKLRWILTGKELAETIKTETTRCLYPNALQQYQAGHTVSFGPIAVTQQGLSYNKSMIPWSELGTVWVGDIIIVKRHGKRWASLKLAKVSNIEVLRFLVLNASGKWLDKPLTTGIAWFLILVGISPLFYFLPSFSNGLTIDISLFIISVLALVLYTLIMGLPLFILAWGLLTLQKWSYWLTIVVLSLGLVGSNMSNSSLVWLGFLLYMIFSARVREAFFDV